MKKSIVFISLGPGDPELITLKAFKYLQDVTAIYCPATVKGDKVMSRASDIVKDLGIDSQKIHLFQVPMRKEHMQTLRDYEVVAHKIATHFLGQDKSIAVCAQGDAHFYSSAYYISEWFAKENFPVQRISGVPAFIAAAALANIHIVKQEERLRVIPGVLTDEELIKECVDGNTVVIMKPLQSEAVIKQAIKTFKHTVFHYFENIGIPEKEFYTQDKEEILAREFLYFSLLIIQKQ